MAMQLELEHFLTLHLRSRKFPSAAAYTETVQVLGRLTDHIRNNSQPGPAQQVLVTNLTWMWNQIFISLHTMTREIALFQRWGGDL